MLVDFWSTTCRPCVAELPLLLDTYDKFHGQGFEIVGISCDIEKEKLQRFLKEKRIPWPQYFDGKQQDENLLTLSFGIDAIPHMLLVDKKGLLRFDNLRTQNNIHPKENVTNLDDKILRLLAED